MNIRNLIIGGMILLFNGALLHAQQRTQNQERDQISKLILKGSDDSIIRLATIQKVKATVFVFLSPECPICQQCTSEINVLESKYAEKDIQFYGVIPGSYYDAGEIQAFKKKYKLAFPLVMDTSYELTQMLSAIITPQVVIMDSEFVMLYSGAVDNSYLALGKKNAHTSAHYTSDALAAIVKEQAVAIKRTPPIGCRIERIKLTKQ